MFYTYLWLREDGTPYYVGKGSGDRAYRVRTHRFPPPPKDRIIVQEFESEEDAFFAEKFLIAAYGREDLSEGRLLNLTDGGENPPSPKGKKRTTQHQKKLTESRRQGAGWKPSEATRQKMSEGNKGRTPWNKGMKGEYKIGPMAEEAREHISVAHKGIPMEEERKQKIRDTLKRQGFSPSDAARDLASMKRWGTHVRKISNS